MLTFLILSIGAVLPVVMAVALVFYLPAILRAPGAVTITTVDVTLAAVVLAR
jgi:hypothetical protein